MTFYDDMAAVAADVLAEFKQGAVVLIRNTRAPADPSTPWIPGAATPTSYTLDATVRGVSGEFVDGTEILATDLQVTSAVPPVVPSIATDTMTIDGRAVTILRIEQVPAAGTPVAYRFLVRG